MTDDNVTQLPVKIHLDLDAVERPSKDIKEPFVVKINGRTITMIDPSDLDWRDLLLMESPMDFLRYALSPEDKSWLTEQATPGWKFSQLMEAYYSHYDLEEKQREAQRQAQFSNLRGV